MILQRCLLRNRNYNVPLSRNIYECNIRSLIIFLKCNIVSYSFKLFTLCGLCMARQNKFCKMYLLTAEILRPGVG